jgi:hypothetical protein
MPTDPPPEDFRRRDPSKWLVRIVVALAVILAVAMIDFDFRTGAPPQA